MGESITDDWFTSHEEDVLFIFELRAHKRHLFAKQIGIWSRAPLKGCAIEYCCVFYLGIIDR